MVVTRRTFLRGAGLATGSLALGAALGACSGVATTTPAASRGGATAPAVTATPIAAATPAAGGASARAFKFAYLTLGWAGTEIIHKLDLLGKRGWSIEWQTVGPISGVVNAFASGQVDLCHMSATIAAQMHESGLKLRIVGTAVATLGAIVVPGDSPIASVPGLRGRKVGGIPGSTTLQDVNASVRKIHGLNLLTDTRFVQATAPADLAALLQRREIEAGIVWEPVTSQVSSSGQFRTLASQQDLWGQASGSPGSQVHVVYLATPRIAAEYKTLIADINAAQAEVAALWQRQDPAAIDAIMQVTQMPREVVAAALGRTTPLHGLTDEQIGTMLAQLRLNREYGTLLTSDLWLDPRRAREELFPTV